MTSLQNINRYLKLFYLFQFFILFYVICYNILTPAQGYEVDLYASQPGWVWASLTSIILFNMYYLSYLKSDETFCNEFPIIFTIILYFTLLSLPFLRGYAIYGRGDVMSHAGYINDILFYNFLSNDDFYPIYHILASEIKILAAIETFKIITILTPILYLMFPVSLYCLAKIVLLNNKILIFLGSIPFISAYASSFTPAGLSLIYMPFLFFLYIKSITFDSANYKLIIIILIIFYTFLHPLASLILSIIFIFVDISKAYLKYIFIFKSNLLTLEHIIANYYKIIDLKIFAIFNICFIIWFSSFSIWANSINKVSNWFLSDAKANPFQEYYINSNLAIDAGYNPNILIIKLFGPIFVFIAIAFILSLYMLKNIKKDVFKHISLISIVFILLCSIVPIFYVLVSVTRLLYYLIPISIILVGFIIYPGNQKIIFSKLEKKYRLIINYTIFLIVASAILLNLFSLHPSPWIITPSMHVTSMELIGMEWFFDHKNEEISSVYSGITDYRFGDAILGHKETRMRSDISKDWQIPEGIPDHLGYTNNTSISEAFNGSRYIIFSKLSEEIYEKVWTFKRRYNKEDFDRLNCDKKINKIYSNKELRVFYHKKISGD